MISVMVVEDHELVRDALARVIDAADDMAVVAVASDCDEASTALGSCAPDVAVVDLRLGRCSGFDVVECVRQIHPNCRVVILTSFRSDRALVASYERGVAGFILKSAPTASLLEAIRDVAAGLRVYDSGDVRAAAIRLSEAGHAEFDQTDDVGRRILVLIAEGMSDHEIAAAVGLNVQTVRNRVSRLLQLFGKHNRTQLALTIDRLTHDRGGDEGGGRDLLAGRYE